LDLQQLRFILLKWLKESLSKDQCLDPGLLSVLVGSIAAFAAYAIGYLLSLLT
jgi:ABC-type spermidine/putrescine transport system permease subunit II